MAEPEPGRGQGARGGGGNISAGFKVDVSSLRELNTIWTKLVANVKAFNAEVKKINPGSIDAFNARNGGSPAGRSGGPTGPRTSNNGGNWNFPPTAGSPTPAGGAPAGGAAPRPAPLPNGGHPPPSGGPPAAGGGGGMPWGAKAGLAAVGAAVAYGGSHAQNMMDAEKMAQRTAWASTSGLSTQKEMDQIRHQWFGGKGVPGTGLTGYNDSSDLMAGMATLQSRQGIGQTASNRALQAGAGRMGNALGSYAAGASGSADLYAPKTVYSMMSIGVKTIGAGGKKASVESIAKQFLMAVYGGRMPTGIEVGAGMAEGTPLRESMNAHGLSPEVQDWIIDFGLKSAKLKHKLGKAPTLKQMESEMSVSGFKSQSAKDALGRTAADTTKLKSQEKAGIEQDLADHALPAMRHAIEDVTTALDKLRGALDSPLGGAAGTIAGAGAAIAPAVSGFMGAAGGMLGFGALSMWQNRNRGGGGPGPRPPGGGPPGGPPPGGGPGGRPPVPPIIGGIGGRAARFARGGLVVGAATIGGSVVGNAVKGDHTRDAQAGLGTGLKWGATGAGLGATYGMFTGPAAPIAVPALAAAGFVVGGVAGFAKGMFTGDKREGLGGPGGGNNGGDAQFSVSSTSRTGGSQEEVDVITGALAGGGASGSSAVPGLGAAPTQDVPGETVDPNGMSGDSSAGISAGSSAGAPKGGRRSNRSSGGGGSVGGDGGSSGGGATRRGAAAIAWMANQSRNPSQSWKNLCLKDVRLSLGVAAKYPSASVGWANTKKRRGKGTPPPGVPVWWSGGFGHVALSAGGGMVWGNDILRDGKIDKTSIAYINRKWGKPYHGWTEDINDVDVYSPSGASVSRDKGTSNARMLERAGNQSSGSRSSGGGGGGSNAAIIARFLRSKGMTSAQVAGVLGNLQVESPGLKPNTQQRGGPAYGVVQWEGSRLTSLKNYAARNRRPISSLSTQLDFLWSELRGPESGGYRRFLAQSGTPTEAAMSWSKYIERPGKPHMAARIKYAKQFAAKGYKDGAWNIATDQLAFIHRGEMVVPSAPAARVRDYTRRKQQRPATEASNAAHTTRGAVHVTLNMPIHMASGTPADAAKIVSAVARRMEQDQRLAAVMAGD